MTSTARRPINRERCHHHDPHHRDPHPYLTGAYAPVIDELDVTALSITGELPDTLNGSFLRNGPNQMFAPSGSYHIFDGDGMVHEVSLRDGTAAYRNRWIRSLGLEAEIAAGRSLYGGMANASFPGPDEVGDAGPIKNVANTHVVRHAGRILCLWEAGPPTVLGRDLSTLGPTDFGGRLQGAMTAHPKIDAESGEMFAFGYAALTPYLRFHAFSPEGDLVRSIDIDLPAPVMMHDFAVTDRHVVFLDSPAVFDFEGFASGGPMLGWKPELGTRVGVMSRDGDGSDLRWIEIENCFVFHFLNAWSTGDRVFVDACRLDRMDIGLDRGRDGSGGDDTPPHLGRFSIDLTAGTASHRRIADLPGDFPRMDDRFAGLEHRYGYVASFAGGRPDPSDVGADGMFDSITVYDLVAETERTHVFGDGLVTGEAVFAPDPSRCDEGRGWLMSHVYDRGNDTSDVVVLDPSDLHAGPVATVHLPRRVPFGFHGSWLSAVR